MVNKKVGDMLIISILILFGVYFVFGTQSKNLYRDLILLNQSNK